MSTDHPMPSLYRLWNLGQQHLAAGRYVPARRALESAENLAWRQRDVQSLARLYLPLLEARRQIRYNAAEGILFVLDAGSSPMDQQKQFREFLASPAGTILLPCATGSPRYHAACLIAGSVQYESRRSGRWLESLLLLTNRNETRLAPLADPTFSAGLPVFTTTDGSKMIGPSTDPHLAVPLPPPGVYTARNTPALHALLRESLLIAPEALALKWQHRHPPGHANDPWEELAWLRLALRIDPACEPITMRLIALAEAVNRM
ncbi:MAG: hypothetical protein ACTHN5_14360 [Phycisphaerae bacterium]